MHFPNCSYLTVCISVILIQRAGTHSSFEKDVYVKISGKACYISMISGSSHVGFQQLFLCYYLNNMYSFHYYNNNFCLNLLVKDWILYNKC